MLYKSNEAWVDGMRAALAQTLPNLSEDGRRILLAQAALESGFGKTLAAQANNPFNIVAGHTWKGQIVVAPDALPTDPNRTQAFRSYATIGEGVADLYRVISLPRYNLATQYLQSGDAPSYILALSEGGYFETPYATYLEGVVSNMEKL